MNTIKIKPYPNFQITEECVQRDIVPNTIPHSEANEREFDPDRPMVMITEFENGDRRVVRPGPAVRSDNQRYCSVFPNPVHLFYDSAIEFFNDSEETRKKSFPTCAQKTNKMIGDIYFLDIDADQTHRCYDRFFKLRINSIIMLSTSVEAFINHSIPNDYSNRDQVERYGKFKDKLRTDLPNSLGLVEFWEGKDNMWNEIFNLYHMRNDLIHLKTNSQDGFKAYFEVIRKMLEYDIAKSIQVVGEFMNEIQHEFIVFDEI